jgi:hypothetical protein
MARGSFTGSASPIKRRKPQIICSIMKGIGGEDFLMAMAFTKKTMVAFL